MTLKKSGLTIIEILVVVGIIAILAGLLIPATSVVRKAARETKQRAQFTSIDLGLAAFKNDYGDYPPSTWWDPAVAGRQDYCGAQKLAEALMGWDLLGFHPESAWRGDGLDSSGGLTAYSPPSPDDANLKRRRDRYIEMEGANAFKLGATLAGGRDGLFPDTSGGWGGLPLAPSTYVICDVFDVPQRKIFLPDPLSVTGQRSVTPGTPVLYYKANVSRKLLDPPDLAVPETSIYCARDNFPLIRLGRLADAAKPLPMRRRHPLEDFGYFYNYVRDPKVQARPWPYRPDSYLLISAGADGIYGTGDDICNFKR